MPFHVEIRRGIRNARAFNLTEDQLRAEILEPWVKGQVVEFGDHRWPPSESRLTVLEGAKLDGPDLAFGQGWNNALKSADDVTERVLAKAPSVHTDVAVLAGSERPAMEAFLIALGLRPVAWDVVRAELLVLTGVVAPPDGTTLAATAVVIVISNETLAFDVGLALGALGGRAILTQVSEQAAPAGLSAIRLDTPGLAPLHALAQRLRSAGCDVQPTEGWDAPGRFSH
jgi:hypothetical protein